MVQGIFLSPSLCVSDNMKIKRIRLAYLNSTVRMPSLNLYTIFFTLNCLICPQHKVYWEKVIFIHILWSHSSNQKKICYEYRGGETKAKKQNNNKNLLHTLVDMIALIVWFIMERGLRKENKQTNNKSSLKCLMGKLNLNSRTNK